MSSRKKQYDFLVQIPGYPLPFGVKATNDIAAHKIIMNALLEKGKATKFISFNKCKVHTKHIRISQAKTGIITNLEF